MHAFQGTRWTVAHEVPHAIGNHHPSIAPYGLFHTADAPVQIACGNDNQWRALAGLLGIDDDRFASQPPARRAPRRAGRRARGRPRRPARAETWLARLADLGIPAGKVRTLDDVYTWDQTRSQGLVVEVDHPTLGTVELPGPPLRFDDNAYAGDPGARTCRRRGSASTTRRSAHGSTRSTEAPYAGGLPVPRPPASSGPGGGITRRVTS